MTTDPNADPRAAPTATYRIRVQGHIDARLEARLGVGDLQSHHDGTTTVDGRVSDQAALHGLLRRIRDLGLTIVSVKRFDSSDEASGAGLA